MRAGVDWVLFAAGLVLVGMASVFMTRPRLSRSRFSKSRLTSAGSATFCVGIMVGTFGASDLQRRFGWAIYWLWVGLLVAVSFVPPRWSYWLRARKGPQL